MTDTFVDGKVQRIQAMLYAKASNEPETRFRLTERNLERHLAWSRVQGNSHARFGSRSMGKHTGREAGRCALCLL